MSILDTLNPDQEALVLDAVEGVLTPSQRAAFDRLTAEHPRLEAEVARLSRTKAAVISMPEFDLSAPNLVASVFDRLDAESAPLQLRRMDLPHRHRRLPLSAGRVRSLVAAAALVLTAALSLSFLRSGNSTPQPAPGPTVADANPTPGDSTTPFETSDPAVELAAAAIEERTIELAHANWAQADRTEPTLAEAVELLAENRLVIRALAPSSATATAGRDALAARLDATSAAWHLDGPASAALASRFKRPATEAVYAMDDESGTMLEIPSPRLFAVWNARVDQTESAIASLVHNLRDLGLLVRLEASPDAVEFEPALDDALWWNRAPSTWQPVGAAPIVIDALDR